MKSLPWKHHFPNTSLPALLNKKSPHQLPFYPPPPSNIHLSSESLLFIPLSSSRTTPTHQTTNTLRPSNTHHTLQHPPHTPTPTIKPPIPPSNLQHPPTSNGNSQKCSKAHEDENEGLCPVYHGDTHDVRHHRRLYGHHQA